MNQHKVNAETTKNPDTVFIDLGYGFMSMHDYREGISSGRVKPYRTFADDLTFENENPEHPMSASCRLRRIQAADTIRKLARAERSLFSYKVLRIVRKSLFDCCAAVRLTILETLFFLNDIESIKDIKELLQQERDSVMVRDRAELFLRLMESPYIFPSTPKQIVVATDYYDLLKALDEYSAQRETQIRLARPQTPDIIAFPAAAVVVEPSFVGDATWQEYVDYLIEADEEEDTPLIVLGEGCLLPFPRKKTIYCSPWLIDPVVQFIDEHMDSKSMICKATTLSLEDRGR